MTKEEKTMEEQLNEDVLAEQAEVQAEVEAKESKKNQKRWYIVHTYSGYENKVKVNLEKRIEYMNMGDKIFRIEVPQKTVVQMKGGKKQEKEEKVFPGYVLVEMIMDEDSWYVVRHTSGVTKFVGSVKKPIPVKESEIKRIYTDHLHKLKKLNLMLKPAIKLELFQDHLQTLMRISLKFILINLNLEQMFQSSVVKHLLNWNTNKSTNYNNQTI